VVLNIARVYAESNDLDHAAKVIEADSRVRSHGPHGYYPRREPYEQLKQTKGFHCSLTSARQSAAGDVPQ